MIVKLSEKEQQFLFYTILEQCPSILLSFKEIEYQYRYLNTNTKHKKGKILKKYYFIPDDFCEEIREICMDKLQLIGFASDGDPNKYGVMLEDLIDIFYWENTTKKVNTKKK